MPNMIFQEEDGYIVCYIDGKEVSRAKKAADGTSTADVINIINEQIKANPTLSGTEPNLEGLELSGDKYAVPQGSGGSSLMSDIVDANGNARFVEGNGTTTSITTLTIDYNKWSLSGTHLMCVVSGQVNADFLTNPRDVITTFEVPEYIANKIVGTNIERKDAYFFTSELTQTTLRIGLQKSANSNILKIVILESASLTKFQTFRIQFDLLIDTD